MDDLDGMLSLRMRKGALIWDYIYVWHSAEGLCSLQLGRLRRSEKALRTWGANQLFALEVGIEKKGCRRNECAEGYSERLG